MQNYYTLLGINESASDSEIRRAYRILARRYHPDLNPAKQATEKFKSISEAYRVLSDEQERREYDRSLSLFKQSSMQKKFEAFRDAQQKAAERSRTDNYYQQQKKDYNNIKNFTKKIKPPSKLSVKNLLKKTIRYFTTLIQITTGKVKSFRPVSRQNSAKHGSIPSKISIIEVSITIAESIQGIKKTIEIEEPDGIRKIRVQIPAAVRSGSVVRLRSNNSDLEELVLIIRLAQHPFMHIDARGLIVDIAVTLTEAFFGANIKVPTTDGDPIVLKIPPGTQSGDELRVRGKGIMEKHERGDIIYRIMVQHPGAHNDLELQKRISELALFYTGSVRNSMPKTLLEAARMR